MRIIYLIPIISILSINNLMADVKTDYIPPEKFVIKNVKVDEIAATSEEARRVAIERAQKIAFGVMIKRIFEDFDDEKISFDKISNIVQAIEYRNEVITDRRYRAVVDVSFQPEQTQFFINNYYLNKPIKRLRILLIPIFNENGMVKLWQKGNLWYEVWQSFHPSEMIDIKVPLGDIDDMINFKVSELKTADKETIRGLERLYRVDKIIIAELNYAYQTVSPEIFFKAYLRELGDAMNATLVAKSEGFKSDDYNKHLGYLLEKVIADLESGWMNYNNSLDESGRQEFVVKVRNIHDWIDIKKRISALKIVKSFKVDSYSARYAKITIEFIDVSLKIIDTLKDLGFKISREQNYVILQTK